MALVLGTNCGFVETAPTNDPNGTSNYSLYDHLLATKHISPSSAISITQIGFWRGSTYTGSDFNFKVGIYSDDDTGEPNVLLYESDLIDGSNSENQWFYTDIDFEIDPDTIYWIVIAIDVLTGGQRIQWDEASSGGSGFATKDISGQGATFPSDWGSSSTTDSDGMIAIYAVWEEGGEEYSQSIIESITFSPTIQKGVVLGNLVESLTFADSVSTALAKVLDLTDTLTIGDSINRVWTAQKILTDTLTFADSVIAVKSVVRTL